MEEHEKTCIPVLSEGDWHLLPEKALEAVVSQPVIVKVPEAPADIRGVSVYGGRLIPYYFLKEQGGGREQGSAVRCGVIIHTENGLCGIAADEISGQKTMPDREYMDQMTVQLKKILGEQ